MTRLKNYLTLDTHYAKSHLFGEGSNVGKSGMKEKRMIPTVRRMDLVTMAMDVKLKDQVKDRVSRRKVI